MSEVYTEAELLIRVRHLTRAQLTAFVEAQVVVPTQTAHGRVYRRMDVARLELLCEFSETFEMNEEAASVVISVLDQLHAARRDLKALARAIMTEPPETRARLGTALRQHQAISDPDELK